MSLLFETIKVVNGRPQHLGFHEERMNRSRKEVWPSELPLLLGQEISVPVEFSSGVVRCNLYYGPEIHRIGFAKYEKRIIRSLKMVSCPDGDYHLKYADRSFLESIFSLRGRSDEVVIVKNGLITDTSMSNLIFTDGKNWVTPARPLLNGTCRARLLAEGRISEQDIKPGDLHNFLGCKIINAMRDPGGEPLIPVSEIS
jgi:4-amino-4-deoxychorismate lyase